jgi:hypothetical protein
MEDHGRRQTRCALDAIAGTSVRLDQAGVNGKALTADQPSIDAGLLDGLEQPPQQLALATQSPSKKSGQSPRTAGPLF